MKCIKCDKTATAKNLCSKCYGTEWYSKNKEKVKQRKNKWYVDNRESAIERVKKWRKAHPDIVRKLDSNRDRVKDAKYYKNKYHNNINYRLKVILRNRLRTALKHNFKSGKTLELLGCSIDEFKTHIESKWQLGMTWANHSCFGWHIDHIIPLDSFDLSNPEQLAKASHYTNMQPLWWDKNLKKRDTL